jgi:membrane associated rhomboid family serine protease
LLPLKDLNRSSTTPHVNRLLLAANIVIFVVYWLAALNILLDTAFASSIEENFVMIPYNITHGQLLYTLFTSMFMHAGWIHLLGNMLYLYVFGDNVEDAFGHIGYLVFYVVCGLAAAFSYILSIVYAPTIGSITGFPLSSDLATGVLGASGAISGVLGAYAVLYPKAKIISIVFYVLIPIPAILFLGIWFAMQWIEGFFDISGGVAYTAHIGGFIAGMMLGALVGLRRKKKREMRLRL